MTYDLSSLILIFVTILLPYIQKNIKQVFSISNALLKDLSTDVEFNPHTVLLYSDKMFDNLPFSSFLLDFSDTFLHDMHNLDYDDKNGLVSVFVGFLTMNDNKYMLIRTQFMNREKFRTRDNDMFDGMNSSQIVINLTSLIESAQWKNTSIGLKRIDFRTAENGKYNDSESIVILPYVFEVLMYLISCAPDVRVTNSSRGRYKPVRPRGLIQNRVTEIQQWEVGFRYAQSVKQKLHSEGGNGLGILGSGCPKKPHVRKAHWHRYWTGPRSQPEKRKLTLKWVSRCFVNTSFELEGSDIPFVCHVENRPRV